MPPSCPSTLTEVDLPLPDRRVGKVRVSYALPATDERLFVTTDRLSAFDRIIRRRAVQGPGAQPARRLVVRADRATSSPTTSSPVPDPNVLVAVAAQPLPVEVDRARPHHRRHEHLAVEALRRRGAHDLRLHLPRRPAEEHRAADADHHADHEGGGGRPRRGADRAPRSPTRARRRRRCGSGCRRRRWRCSTAARSWRAERRPDPRRHEVRVRARPRRRAAADRRGAHARLLPLLGGGHLRGAPRRRARSRRASTRRSIRRALRRRRVHGRRRTAAARPVGLEPDDRAATSTPTSASPAARSSPAPTRSGPRIEAALRRRASRERHEPARRDPDGLARPTATHADKIAAVADALGIDVDAAHRLGPQDARPRARRSCDDYEADPRPEGVRDDRRPLQRALRLRRCLRRRPGHLLPAAVDARGRLVEPADARRRRPAGRARAGQRGDRRGQDPRPRRPRDRASAVAAHRQASTARSPPPTRITVLRRARDARTPCRSRRRRHPHEECGVLGLSTPHGEGVAQLAFFGLYALQHRGQEAAGIAVSDGMRARLHKDVGLVSQVFTPERLAPLTGYHAIGHTRYSTTGAPAARNAQPFLVETMHGPLAARPQRQPRQRRGAARRAAGRGLRADRDAATPR